jgi:hypothetical protein
VILLERGLVKHQVVVMMGTETAQSNTTKGLK